MSYALFIARRYLQTKKRSALVSRITSIAVGGVFVGTMTLVIVLSVINGFETELRQRIVGFNTHVLIFARSPEAWAHVDTALTRLEKQDDIVATAPFIRSEALAAYEVIPGRRTKLRGVIVKGIDIGREHMVSSVVDSIRPPLDSFDTSSFEDDPPRIGAVLGLDLALDLGIGLGEEFSIVTAPATVRGPDVEPQRFRCRALGFFNSGMYEFDSRFVYVDITAAAAMFDFETGLRGASIETTDMYRAEEIDREVQHTLNMRDYGTNNWIQLNQNLFSYMKIEKILMFLMLTLIILVAAFNLVGMLTMVIMEKRREIGILRSIGASSRGVMAIFMIEGTAIGVLGTAGGLAAGLLASGILDRVRIPLPGDVYFIKTLPVLVQGSDLALIGAISVVICFLATVYPSWEASRLTPVEAIRDL
ncbi:MAG TPA: FtsX-like permease family protein [Candidatus Krumholzibacteria bacterium]|nr:FtsX-like permease family protein [Candidatus Krumholzibacteria bacterium]